MFLDEEAVREKAEKDAPRGVLVGVLGDTDDAEDMEEALEELSRLCETAGIEVCGELTQVRERPSAATCIGSGKLRELSDFCEAHEISLVVFDYDLSPVQIKNLENAITSEVRVIDRTMLILDIFAQNATTGEGMLQVEIAQLKYNVPRLTGRGKELSRLGGGIGTRGPGESKLETDRRHVRRRIDALTRKLETLRASRDLRRKSRQNSTFLQVTIAGYTNAGKSTLLNYLTNAGILAEDKLFATLDPTTRKLKVPLFGEVFLTDTVGFIDRLPHHLVESFASTLDEVAYADLLLVVLDASDPALSRHMEVTKKLLSSLYEQRKVLPPETVFVYNKCDLISPEEILPHPEREACVFVSARTGEGIERLLELVSERLSARRKRVTYHIPHTAAEKLDFLYRRACVLSVEYREDGAEVEAVVDDSVQGKLKEFEQQETL